MHSSPPRLILNRRVRPPRVTRGGQFAPLRVRQGKAGCGHEVAGSVGRRLAGAGHTLALARPWSQSRAGTPRPCAALTEWVRPDSWQPAWRETCSPARRCCDLATRARAGLAELMRQSLLQGNTTVALVQGMLAGQGARAASG